jgi:hypothetical protein
MKHLFALAALTAAITLATACGDYSSPASYGPTAPDSGQYAALASKASINGRSAFGFNGTASGFLTGVVSLTGGGSYDVATASNTPANDNTSVRLNGGFRCTAEVAQGPLKGCLSGEGVRWETAQLLASTNFKCSEGDAVKSAVTGADRAVLLAEFYRAGDGNDESFTAQMIVSSVDLDPALPGVQSVWVQGVGCGSGDVAFGSSPR